MVLTARHSMELPASDKAPAWVHLLPAGTFSGVDGRGPYHVADAGALIDRSMQAERLTLDENHSTDFAVSHGTPSPAQGWIVAMQARADGIWGRMEWTAAGGAKVVAREYRSISPVYEHTPDGQVLRLLRAGLTNVPNLTLTSLHMQGTAMDLTQMRAALGLAATADDAAVLAAITALRGQVAAHASELGRIATAAGVAADARPEVILTALQAQTSGASAEVQRLAGVVTALQSQLTTMSNDGARIRAETAIEAATRAGKVIVLALREHYIARHMADPAGVQKELDAMPSLHAGGYVPPASDASGDTPTAQEMAVARMMSIDPKKVVEARRLRMATGQQGAA